MRVLVRTFLDIALLRLGPEDLPASRFLLYCTFVIAALVNIPATWVIFRSSSAVFQAIFVDFALLVVFLWVLLRAMGFANRFEQTLTAVLGTSTLLNLASMPFVYWNSLVPAELPKPALPSAAILVILLWSFAVDGHILARAMSRPFMIGLVIAIGYFFLHTTVLFQFTPVLR